MHPPIDLAHRLLLLEKVSAVYTERVTPAETACHRGCAHCCTRNVSMTTLEGYAILSCLTGEVKNDLLNRVRSGAARRRFQPKVTINRMAEIAVSDKELPTEESEVSWGPCPILTEDVCPIYPFRPFGCRSMASRKDCGKTGYAEMDPFMLTMNTVFQQVIEQVDRPGYTGNFTDVLLYLSSAGNLRRYEENRPVCGDRRLLFNRSLNVLMVPPRHRDRMRPVLEALHCVLA